MQSDMNEIVAFLGVFLGMDMCFIIIACFVMIVLARYAQNFTDQAFVFGAIAALCTVGLLILMLVFSFAK